MLVGRDAEQRALGELLRLARDGRSAALVLRGEPGVGNAELVDPVVLSNHALRQLSRLHDEHERFVSEHHREPSASELAERTGLSRAGAAHRPPRRLRREQPRRRRAALPPVVDEPAEGEYERVLDAVEAEELASLLSLLSDRERTVLRWRYGLDGEELQPQDIARRLGLSTRRVREIERRARAKLAAAERAGRGAPAA